MANGAGESGADAVMSKRGESIRIVAVIEVGTTSIRLMIAQIDTETGAFNCLDPLQQAVALGRDTFTEGRIGQETTEECVQVLRSFVRKLKEYRIENARDIMAVATSAVREASNQDTFLDRLFVATGIDVRVIDEAEVNRFTYSAVHSAVERVPALGKRDTLVVEVGGGSTEVLMLHRGRVGDAHSHRLGSLRLRRMLEEYRAPGGRLSEILRSHVDRSIRQIRGGLSFGKNLSMLSLGGDARLACSELDPDWDQKDVAAVDVSALSRLTDKLLELSVDEVVRRYHIAYPDAETLAPALLVYTRLAQTLGLKEIHVGTATLRDGILAEMAIHGSWTEQYQQQIVNSALELGKKYDVDKKHARHVAELARKLFRALRDEHRLNPRYELILNIAALLHEVGLFISNRSHHKHSMYLIQNSDLFGLGGRDLLLTALVARYHRRAHPKPDHEGFSSLDRESRVAVAKMAAILRVADALDRGHVQRRRQVDLLLEPGRLVITVKNPGDLTLEQHGLQEKGGLFEQIYGMKVHLRGSGGTSTHGRSEAEV